ncbi:DUF4190 domain-containing protein [Streptomyces sp. NPDC021098]|uniref:DUF4190 domain-containing protein n=1 Tax=unclassified Streptomyces TaxID=2593676 RepID=UPI0037928F6D
MADQPDQHDQPRRTEPRDHDPWAPPAPPTSLDKPPSRPSVAEQQTITSLPTGPAVPPLPSAPGPPPPAPAPPPPAPGPPPPAPGPPPGGVTLPSGATLPGSVPPPPPAPTGPGTPSAYQGTPYGTGGYGHPAPYGAQTPYGGPGYGYPGTAYPAYPGPGHPGAGYGQGWQPGGSYLPNNGTGTAALVLGIIGLVFFASVVLAIILGVLAIIFGFLGRAKAARGEANNGGSALAGLILGAAAVVAGVVMIFVYVAAANDDSADGSTDSGYADISVVRLVPPAATSR